MIICDATKDDLGNIIAIENICFPTTAWTKQMLVDAFNDSTCQISIIKNDTQVVGYSVLRIVGKEAEIDNIAIAPNFRRQGLGKKLLNHLLSLSKEQNAEKVFLEVDTNSVEAISLYEKIGFKRLGLRKNYYRENDAYTYALRMTNEE